MASKGEQDFITERTRSLLVRWGDQCVLDGMIPESEVQKHGLYLDRAREKGWVSKRGLVLTGKGFAAAASFLRR